ncbi:autotransporter family protein [Turicimonas sp. TL08]
MVQQDPYRNIGLIAGFALAAVALFPVAVSAEHLTFLLNDETIKKLEEQKGRQGIDWTNKVIDSTAAWKLVDEAGNARRPTILSGDEVIIEDGWTLTFSPLPAGSGAGINFFPRIGIDEYLTTTTITGKGNNDRIIVQGNTSVEGLYIGVSFDINRDGEVIDPALPWTVTIEDVDLDISHVTRGIYQSLASTVTIKNQSTKIASTWNIYPLTGEPLGAIAIQSTPTEDKSNTSSDAYISIESSQIDLSSEGRIVFQWAIDALKSTIDLNVNNDGEVLLRGFADKAPVSFLLEGENAKTNIGGSYLLFETKGNPHRGLGKILDDDRNLYYPVALLGGHAAYIEDGATLNIFSKKVEGTVLFITDTQGRLLYGSETSKTKSIIQGGFEFAPDSGKNQVYFGPGSVFNGHILDATASANETVPTFFMKESTWNVLTGLAENQDYSSTVSSLKLDNSTVDLTREKDTSLNATYGTVTLGTLDSTKGIFRLDVDIANKLNDKIIVKDNVTGKSFLSITSAGTGNGTDSEILVKAPVDTPEESFLLEPKEINGQKYRAIDEGARIYRLANVQNETEKDKRDWYLTPCKEGECLPVEEEPEPPEPTPDPPDPTPPDPPKPDKPSPDNPGPALPVYSPSAEAIFAMAGMGSQTAFYQGQLSDLRERLGEIRRDVRGEVREGLWASVGAQKDRIAGFSSTSFKSTVYRFNFGYDTAVGEWLIGGNFKYASANQKTKDAFFKAKGDAHSEGLNAYAVWHNEKGCYADLILSADRYHQRLNTSMLDGTGVRGTYRNWGVGVSAEVGKKSFINVQKTWFVEPQLQLAYYRIHGDNFTLSNGMKVKQGNFNSLTGRLGVALGRDIKSSEGQDKGQVYLRAGVKNEFLGKQKVYINDERFSDKLTGNRVYYGLATDWLVRKNLKVYGHIEREKGAHYTKEIEAQVGLKWQF